MTNINFKEIYLKIKDANNNMYKYLMIQEKTQIVLNGVQINHFFLINSLGILQELPGLEGFFNDENQELFNYEDSYSSQDHFKFFVKDKENFIELRISVIIKVKTMIQLLHSFPINFISKIDDYYEPSKNNLIAYSSFIVLKPLSLTLTYSDIIFQSLSKSNIGDEIFCISSSLSTLLYQYFSSSISKGVISSKFKKEILLFDLRVLSYSQGALVFNKQSNFFAILFPAISIGRLNNLLGFGIEINTLFSILHQNINQNNKFSLNKLLNKVALRHSFSQRFENIKDSVFIIYYDNTTATCFYIGKKLVITNKHFFFFENKLQTNKCRIRNNLGDFAAELIVYSKNEIDLAVVEIIDKSFDLPGLYLENKLKLSKYNIKKGDTVYCVNYGLFNKYIFEAPLVSKGLISKIIKFNNINLIYQLDCSIYRGASGGPVLNEYGEIVGITYQNIIINSGDDKEVKSMEIPNPSFAFSRELLFDIINNNSHKEKLVKLWVFNVNDSYLNKLISWDIQMEAKY